MKTKSSILSYAQNIEHFKNAIRATGLEPPSVIEPNKIHRFPGIGKGPNNTSAWCICYSSGFSGHFGDWSTDLSEKWTANKGKHYSATNNVLIDREIKQSLILQKTDIKLKRENAAKKARNIWQSAYAAPNNHQYLMRKNIQPYGAKLYGKNLILPIINLSKQMTSLQFIYPNGRKMLLTGGQKQGCFIPVTNNILHVERAIICEGWSTGCSIAESAPNSLVISAIDASNLKSIAMAARNHWPNIELIIAGDDDRNTPGNPGATKAKEAAIAANALLSMPQWPKDAPNSLTDFNDLSNWITRRAI